jgi:hypothetical protein
VVYDACLPQDTQHQRRGERPAPRLVAPAGHCSGPLRREQQLGLHGYHGQPDASSSACSCRVARALGSFAAPLLAAAALIQAFWQLCADIALLQ